MVKKVLCSGAVERFYLRTFPKGLKIQVKTPISTVARKILDKSKTHLRVNEDALPKIEKGLKTVIRWHQFATAFKGDEVPIRPYLLYQILSGNILGPWESGKIYQRETVISLEEAEPYMDAFLRAYLGLPYDETMNIVHFPTFYVLGPMADLKFRLRSPLKRAAFLGIDVPGGELYYIKPTLDNLVALQFRILDHGEKILKRYAFDRSVPSYFSTYNYAEEEERQFKLFNKHLFTGDGYRALKKIKRFLLEQQRARYKLESFASDPKAKIDVPRLKFEIAGPLRCLRLKVQNLNPQTKEENPEIIFSFPFLNLEPGKAYIVSMHLDNIPRTKKKTMVVEFTCKEEWRKGKRRYYFMGEKNAFIPIYTRGVKPQKGRIVMPSFLRPRSWDDEPETKLVL